MATDQEAIEVIARAIQSAIAHPIGFMRLMPESEQELAVDIINALEDGGFQIVRRDQGT